MWGESGYVYASAYGVEVMESLVVEGFIGVVGGYNAGVTVVVNFFQ